MPTNLQPRGFTIVEMLVVIGIWSAMSTIILFDYPRIIAQENLKNATGEISLAFREAQVWGTSARAFPFDSTDSDRFDRGFGVFLETGSNDYYIYGGVGTNNSNPNHSCFDSENIVQQSTFSGGVTVESICVAVSGTPDNCVLGNTDEINIHFRRPFLDAIILKNTTSTRQLYAKVVLTSPRKPELQKTVIIWATGRFYTQE